jgi:hypothetical protein
LRHAAPEPLRKGSPAGALTGIAFAMGATPATLVIACGALAREIVALRTLNNWPHMAVQCLPADLHNRPDKIPALVRDKIRAARGQFTSIFVAYADCGTGGLLDAVLAEEGVERIPGAHCYEFFAGTQAFEQLAEQEIGTFYLTDFLLKHFDRLILRGLGIDKHPELLPIYFGNYTKLTYLAQISTLENVAAGEAAAKRLGLAFEHHVTGYGGLAHSLQRASEITRSSDSFSNKVTSIISWQN